MDPKGYRSQAARRLAQVQGGISDGESSGEEICL